MPDRPAVPPLKAFIFDLGGVVLPIDYQRTIRAFTSLGIADADKLYDKTAQDPLFDELELGHITPAEFRDRFRVLVDKPELSDASLDRAWCALLGEWPMERLSFLRDLKRRYPLFLLSNTNAIHAAHFLETLEWTFESGKGLSEFFDGVFFSHEIHARKPHAEAFQHVLKAAEADFPNQLADLKPEEVMFLDDSEQHIAGAESLGLRTIHITPEMSMLDALEGVI